MSDNYFTALAAVNVKEHVEKKGGFSYLSWPYAVGELRKRHPGATWEVCRFNGLPFLQVEGCGCFVEVAVTVEGVRLSQIHPVLDNRNKPIPLPNSFEINTSLQRALVKAIALHGLGLYIYAGEDLPDSENPSAAASDPLKTRTETLRELCAKAQVNMIDLLAKAGRTTAEELSENDWQDAEAMLKRKAIKIGKAARA